MRTLRLLLFFALTGAVASAQTSISASNITNSFGQPLALARLCFLPVNGAATPAGFRVGTDQVVPNETCGTVTAGVLQSGLSVVPVPTGTFYHVYVKTSFSNNILRDYGLVTITGSSWTLDGYDPTNSTPVGPLTMGAVTTGAAACNLTPGTGGVYLLNCSVPQGATGAAPTLSIGTVSSLSYGASPTFAFVPAGAGAYTVNVGIPAGPAGSTGATGPTGAAGAAGPPGLPCNWVGSWTASTYYSAGQCYVSGGYNYLVGTGYTSGSVFGSTDTSNTTVYANSSTGALPTGAAKTTPVYLTAGTTVTPVDPVQGAYQSPNAPAIAHTTPTPDTGVLPASWFSTYHSSGDSITAGFGLSSCSSSISPCYVWQVANALGSPTVSNEAVSGDQACDLVKHAFNDDNPTATDSTLHTVMVGINDADLAGVGAYQNTYSLCDMAALTWLSIPASNKIMGGATTPAANWTTDTTYAQATGLATTTNGAPQTFTFTTPNLPGGPEAEVFVWYRIFDPTSGTTGGNFSAQLGSNVAYYLNSYTSPPVATSNGATDSIAVADLGGVVSSGSHTVTITPIMTTGNTVSILGVGWGPVPTDVTSCTIASGVITLTTSPANTLVAGQIVQGQRFSGCPSYFNGAPLTVLSAGLSTSQFEANIPSGYGFASTLATVTETAGQEYNQFPYVRVGGVSRTWVDTVSNAQATASYDYLQSQNVRYLQGLSFNNLHWVNVRSCFLNNPFDMQGGTNSKHPNGTLGSQELTSCFLGETEYPAVAAPVDTTISLNRAITSTTNCQLSITDQSVTFDVSTAMNCELPTPAAPGVTGSAYNISPTSKQINLENIGAGAVTLTANQYQSGDAVGLVLASDQAATIRQTEYRGWSLSGYGLQDVTQWNACKAPEATPYTLLLTDQCVAFNEAGALTYTLTGLRAGKIYGLSNETTLGPLTFTNGSTSAWIPPGGNAFMEGLTTSGFEQMSVYNPGSYLNCTTIAAPSYTLLPLDPCIYYAGTANVTITLPTTFWQYKSIQIFNVSTGTVTFTGASAGNANAQVIYGGSGGTLTSYGSGDWQLTVGGPGLMPLTLGTAIASASTVAPVSPVVHVTGTTAINTVTAPPGCVTSGLSCQITVIPDGLWATTTSGNIAIASTAVVSKALILTYDPATAKWYPSY